MASKLNETVAVVRLQADIAKELLDTPVFRSCLSQIRAADVAERVRRAVEAAEMRNAIAALGNVADRCERFAAAAGVKLGTARIVPKDGGFETQRFEAMTDGTARWNKVTWHSNRPAADRAFRLYV
jgi:hypothetical protein